MRTSQFTNEQIAMALRQAETGTPLEEICRKLGINESTFYRWKRRFGELGVTELRELRQLREENWRVEGEKGADVDANLGTRRPSERGSQSEGSADQPGRTCAH